MVMQDIVRYIVKYDGRGINFRSLIQKRTIGCDKEARGAEASNLRLHAHVCEKVSVN